MRIFNFVVRKLDAMACECKTDAQPVWQKQQGTQEQQRSQQHHHHRPADHYYSDHYRWCAKGNTNAAYAYSRAFVCRNG